MKLWLDVSENFIIVSGDVLDVGAFDFIQLKIKGWSLEVESSADGWGTYMLEAYNDKFVFNGLNIYEDAVMSFNGVKINIFKEV
jgi:hypothetical protein